MGDTGEVGAPDGDLEDQSLTSSPEALLRMDQSKFAAGARRQRSNGT